MNFRKATYYLASCIAFFICSCGGDDITEPIPNSSGKTTYNGSVKNIINNNCTECHGNPTTQGAPMALTTYIQVKNALETRGLIARINNTSNPMPQAGLMSTNDRNIIQKWQDDGLLEN